MTDFSLSRVAEIYTGEGGGKEGAGDNKSITIIPFVLVFLFKF